jgi:ATP-dependent DNA helicase RecG
MPFYKTDMLVKKENVDRYDDRLDLRINLIESYPLMMGFIEKHLPDPFYQDGFSRISLRYKIFREIIANFLIHREYTKVDPARIIIYKDRIEASNPCYPRHKGLLSPKNSIPFQKNPLISKFFLQLGWVEEIGSGLINVTEYLPKYHKGSSVEFFEDDIFRVIIHLPSATDHAIDDATDRATDDHAEPDIEKQIVTLILKNSSISIAELAEKTKKHRATISRYINSLKEKKIIKRIGTTKKGEWKVIDAKNKK